MKLMMPSRMIEDWLPVEAEGDYGAAATRQKVRWYQTILRIVSADPTVTINGSHNDPQTRASLRKLQQFYGLKPTSYLTVEANAALTQMALEWIYRTRIANTIGKWSSALTDRIKQFQRDYDLTPDGQVGPLTREKMMDVLLAKLPTPIRNFHSQLGAADVQHRQAELLHQGDLEIPRLLDLGDETFDEFDLNPVRGPSGLHGKDDRRPVAFPANVPWRWICRIKVDGLWAGTGVLISSRHVLTAGHVVYGDKNDSGGFRYNSKARSLSVSPAFDGHLLKRDRQFNEHAPFGIWPVDMSRIFMPPCYTHNQEISAGPPTNEDCDLAVLTLKTAIGTRKFTAKKTVLEKGRRKHIFRDFDPLGYWGIDDHNRIEAYTPSISDTFRFFTGGYPGSHKGIMQHVSGEVDNSLISIRFNQRYKYTVDLFHNRFAHMADTTPGQSGSPVWRRESPNSEVRRMVGVITVAGETYNEGVALTPGFLQDIADWAPGTFSYKGQRLRTTR